MGFRMIDLGGVQLNTSITGEGAETMLMLHGFPEFWRSWRDLMREFSRDHRVVVPDMRGYNESSKPAGVGNYGVRTLVGDVAGLIQAIGAPVTLVGHDWGGAVAWAAAAFLPALVKRLIILNAPHPSIFTREILSNPDQQRASQYMHALSRPDAETTFSADGFAPLKRAMGMKRWDAADVAAYVEAWSKPGAFTAMLNYYRAMTVKPPDFERGESPKTSLTPEDAARIPDIRISVPTLVIWGMRDHALLPGNLDGLDQYVRDLRLHRIEGATHWVHREAHDEVVSAMRSFLTSPAV